MELFIIIPHSDNRIKGKAIYFVTGSIILEIRGMLYPPSFSRIAASIMHPAIGASTWALGSHRW